MNEELKNTIAEELEVKPEELTSEMALDDIDNWDSVTALTIMVILSDELGSPVSPNEMRNLKTFGDIEKLVLSKTQD
jgi:acyl carrier protein